MSSAAPTEVAASLFKAIASLADLAAAPENTASTALHYASAANQLAEALAWIRVPGESHGGGAVLR